MYDFSKLIDIINNHEEKMNSMKIAIDSIRDVFYIGKIEAKSLSNDKVLQYVPDDDYDENVIASYNNYGFEYHFYTDNRKHKYTEEEKNDIKLLLRILSLYHIKYDLTNQAENAKYLSVNTALPNVHGYIRAINVLSKRVDSSNYNSYFINLKGFGLINKLFGSKEGDRAIQEYAKVLKSFASNDEIVGHIGGDNFVGFIKRENHDKFINLVTSCPVQVTSKGEDITINLIGVVGYYEIKDNDANYGNVMSNSSMACQYARTTKKPCVALTPELMDMLDSAKSIENTFKEDLENGKFVIHYQPKFDIISRKIIGVEALSRWIHDDKIVPPGVFVPILEKNGEIINLDLYILENLCRDIHNFRNMGHNIVPASCNLSRRDFEHEDLEDRVINIIRKYNVRTEDIVIEVTETTNLEENERLAKFITVMHNNGIKTSIDDFGTGYSSLSVLRDFKVSEIKIDRSFINRAHLNESDEIILGSIINMAKRLAIDVICEGVETQEQADFLLKLGCTNAQGFLYSKPLPKLEFEAFLLNIGSVYD